MLARVLCESVSTHLICSGGKLTIREMAISGFFPNKFCHFLTKTSWSLLGPGVEVGLTPSFIDYICVSLK
jgi:hypothetical protein